MLRMVINMKKYTVIIVISIGIILGFFTGLYLYKIKQVDRQNDTEKIAKLIEDECTKAAELKNNNELVQTNSKTEKTSPNCVLTLKIYYNICGHLIEKKENIKEAEVNLTEAELKEKFSDWEIQKFTPTEIVLYKELNEFCNEHYLLKEKDGEIAIFKLDQNNNQTFLEKTDISTEYLTEKDLENIKRGIIIYSKKELNKTIEDFE